MNGDVSHLALVSGVTVAINTVSAINRGKEPIVSILAGGTAFVALAVFAGLTGQYDLATALAYVFLVSALILRGLPLIQTTNKIAGSK